MPTAAALPIAFVGALLLVPAIGGRGRTAAALVSTPRPDRWGERALPLVGGIAIVAAAASGLVVVGTLRPEIAADGRELLVLWLPALAVAGAGLVDDARSLRTRTRLLVQAAAGSFLAVLGPRLPVSAWPLANGLVTVLWFIVITNAFNLLDHMDGVAAGAGAIAAAAFGVILDQAAAPVLAVSAYATAGAAAGFLVFNFPPASIFMGDHGSMFVGAVLAVFGVAAADGLHEAGAASAAFLPVLVLIVPLLDTCVVCCARAFARRPITVGGLDHIGHRLVALGVPERWMPAVVYTLAGAGAGVAYASLRVPAGAAARLAGGLLLGVAVAAVVLWGVFVYDGFGVRPASGDRPAGRVDVLGLAVDPFTLDQMADRIDGFIRRGERRRIVLLNAAKVVQARRDPALRTAIASADLVGPDGRGFFLASRLLGRSLPSQVHGTDLMLRMLALADAHAYRVFLLGAAPGVVEDAAAEVRMRYPDLVLAGSHHGFFDAADAARIARRVRAARPDMLFVGLPSQLKESFVARHQRLMDVPVVHGVGGSFDILAGRVRRAPDWVRLAGLEWAFRWWQEPRRLAYRNLVEGPLFLLLVTAHLAMSGLPHAVRGAAGAPTFGSKPSRS